MPPHELGHGVFNLRHTFSQHNTFTLPEGTTANLMDYAGGTELWKYQWDFAHDPEGGWFIFEDSEEGAYDSPECRIALIDYSGNIRDANLDNEDNLSIHWSGDDFECLLFGIELGGTEFDFIGFKANFEEYNGNITFNPSEYKKKEISSFYNFNTSMTRYDFGYFQHEDDPWVMISYVVPQSQANAFEEYLFGGDVDVDFELQLFVDDEQVEEDAIVLISNEPAMPDLRATINYINSNTEFEVKLVIEYLRQCVGSGIGRTPNQSESFPSNDWHTIKSEEEWVIDLGIDAETGRQKIRGGIAYLIARFSDERIDTLRFFIKGQNPTVEQVNNYLNQAPYNQIWFFKKIAFHESGTPNNLTALARQFNLYHADQENLGEDNWGAWSRMPNFGEPCGWGLMQLDNPEPPAQALWDWQANINIAYQLLIGLTGDGKKGVVNRHLNRTLTNLNLATNGTIETIDNHNEGGIHYTHSRSQYFNHAINQHFGELPSGQNRSFIDACWIKTYNGIPQGHFYSFVLGNPTEGTPHMWVIHDSAIFNNDNINYYVRSIGQTNTP